MWTFHLMFVFWSHFTGGLAAGATPFCSGPRHWGQFSSDSARVIEFAPTTIATAKLSKFRTFTAGSPLELIACKILPAHSLRCRRPVCISKIRPQNTIYYTPMQPNPEPTVQERGTQFSGPS